MYFKNFTSIIIKKNLQVSEGMLICQNNFPLLPVGLSLQDSKHNKHNNQATQKITD